MELDPEVHSHPHKIGHRWIDIVLASSALVLSIASIILSIQNESNMRRLVTANIGVKSSVDPHLDRDWSTIVEATVTVRSDLPEAERRVLALEYGMPEGAMVFRARAALLPSLIRQLGLHVGSTGVESAHFRLSNAHRLEAYLKSSASDP